MYFDVAPGSILESPPHAARTVTENAVAASHLGGVVVPGKDANHQTSDVMALLTFRDAPAAESSPTSALMSSRCPVRNAPAQDAR